jgi:hypothetical protein
VIKITEICDPNQSYQSKEVYIKDIDLSKEAKGTQRSVYKRY